MKRHLALLAVWLLLASSGPVLAADSGVGRVLDALSNVLGGDYQRWHGNVVWEHGTTLVMRGDDGQIYSVDMAAVDPGQWQGLQLGQGVSVAATPGAQPHVLIARGVQPDTTSAGAQATTKAFRSAQGTVQGVSGSQLTLRSNDGSVVPFDVSGISDRVNVTASELVVVIYEPGPQSRLTALWVTPTGGPPATSSSRVQGAPTWGTTPQGSGSAQGSQPWRAASPGGQESQPWAAGTQGSAGAQASGQGSMTQPSTGGSASGSSPSASIPSGTPQESGYARLHGYVQSIGMGAFSLKTDDGRTVSVDTSLVPSAQLDTLRPGDLVSVTGKMAGGDQFAAEVVQEDRGAR